ncbi:MAG: VanW family protein, partial [Patescibacteria group bacterium]
MKKEQELSFVKKPWFVTMACLLVLIILVVIGSLVGLNMYNQKVYPGIYLGDNYLGSKNISEVESILEDYIQKLNTQGIAFETPMNFGGQKNTQKIYPIFISTDPDLSREIIKIKKDETLGKVYQIGREGNIFQRLSAILGAWKNKNHVSLVAEINTEELKKILADKFVGAQKEYSNTRAYVNSAGEINLLAGQGGYVFNYQQAVRDLENDLAKLSQNSIELEIELKETDVTLAEAEKLKSELEKIIQALLVKLKYQDQDWEIGVKDISEWFIFIKEDGQVSISLDEEKVSEFLATIATEIDQAPQEPKAEFTDSKATIFQAPRDGLTLDKEATFEKLKTELIDNQAKEIELVVIAVAPQNSLKDSNKFGIQELVGTGHSNFAGSPTNRRHNIATGAAAINGLLIAPGEEFSAIKALGEITAETGYLPELVIKGDRTVPEYGGGLCQIGTTIFRTAVNAGLPITERQEHSYRVVYYEPAGTDATIYQPHPDLRFINDTGNYLVWQTYIDGNDLTFELWGTKDGRIIEVGDPVIYNITRPGALKEIETTELEPGVRKKIESAHNGADAKLTRKVTYVDSDK